MIELLDRDDVLDILTVMIVEEDHRSVWTDEEFAQSKAAYSALVDARDRIMKLRATATASIEN